MFIITENFYSISSSTSYFCIHVLDISFYYKLVTNPGSVVSHVHTMGNCLQLFWSQKVSRAGVLESFEGPFAQGPQHEDVLHVWCGSPC